MSRERDASRALLVAAALGAVATVAWVGAAVSMAGRGFSGGNEGFYLFAYRSWSTSPRTYIGAQYLYGPVFQLLGYDVERLRWFRVLTLLLTAGMLGWSFMRWLRTQRPQAPPTARWEVAGAAVILAGAGIVYGWLPATPGYNDVAALGSTWLVSLLLTDLVRIERGRPTHPLAALSAGVVSAAMVLSKFSTGGCVAVILVVGAVVLHRAGARGLVRSAVCAILGMTAAVLTVDLFVKPLGQLVPPMAQAIRIVSHTHAVGTLLSGYVTGSGRLLVLALLAFVLPGLAVFVLITRSPTTSVRTVWIVAAVAETLNVVLGAAFGGLRSGLGHAGSYSALLTATVLLGAALGTPLRRDRGVPVVLLLLTVPVLQALGTNNPLLVIAVNGAGLWLAALLWIVTGLEEAGRLRRHALAACATAATVLVATCVAISGATHTRDGTPLYRDASGRVAAVTMLAPLRLPDAQATSVNRLRAALGSQIRPAGRPMLAYGELSEPVLELGGDPIGENWFTNYEDGLQAADLRAACEHGNPWGAPPAAGARRPLVGT